MAFLSALGSAAAGGALGNLIGNANGFNMWEADNNFWLDPLGVGLGKIFSGVEKSSNKKAYKQAQKYAELQYQYMLRSARELPLATREGLEAAGYNPLLALGSTGGASSAVSVPSDNYVHKDTFREVNPLILSQLSNMEAERQATKARTTQTKVNTITDILKTVTSAAGAAILAKQVFGKKGVGLSTPAFRGRGNLNGGTPEVVNLTKEPSKVAAALGAVAQGAVAASASALPALGAAGAHYTLGKALLKAGAYDGVKGAGKAETNHRMRGLSIFRKSAPNSRKHN